MTMFPPVTAIEMDGVVAAKRITEFATVTSTAASEKEMYVDPITHDL